MGETNASDFHADTHDVGPDVAPRRGGAAGRAGKANRVIRGLEGYYFLLGLTLSARNEYDGMLIMSKAHDMAVSLDAVARRNPRMYAILVVLTKGDGLLPLILSYGGVAYGLAANHGRVPVSETALRAFSIEAPPADHPRPRPPVESAADDEIYVPQYEPTQGGPAPLSIDPTAGAWEPDAAAHTFPEGLHINETLANRIRAEAYQKYAQSLAEAERSAAEQAAMQNAATGR